MTVQKAADGEFETVRGFYHSLIDALAASGSKVYVGWQKDVYPSPGFLKDSIRKGELYLAREGEEITAAMVFNHDYNESYRNYRWQTEAEDSELMVIHALGVHPRFAGKGYAKALVRKAIDLGRECGMKVIRLDVLEGNIPAQRLYEGFGFRHMATLPMYYEDTGWKNFLLYELLL